MTEIDIHNRRQARRLQAIQHETLSGAEADVPERPHDHLW